ncbi:MAG: AAA family ATPase [Prevotellaceae bacterium]|nr:AAA family ATPase [Prevotellaceae bacterium]
MKIHEFISLIVQRFGFTPTSDQMNALQCFGKFLASREDMPMMLMRGSAGTGKTSLVAAMVQTLTSLRQKVVLMAPTGRAAKVLSISSSMPASTIHRKIYRQKALMGDFNLNDNLHTDTLFVIDEASMISSFSMSETGFGSGSLLDDLVEFVYSGRNCRMLLIGDTAQLPPVGEDESPALISEILYGYGATLFECDLAEVLRQSQQSGILYNATNIRQLIQHEDATELPKIRFRGFDDIERLSGNELIDTLSDSYSRKGIDDTIIITRSNKNATMYNNGIRAQVLDREELLERGDQIMVVKNRTLSKSNGSQNGPSFIANGDKAIVMRVRNFRELYGFHFADATLRFPDYDDFELDTILLTDTLQSDAPALTQEQSTALFKAIEEDYADIPRKADRMKAIREDEYFNALQIKYAYAVTCHKAQGGQWSHVYIDQGYMTDDMLTPDYIHWLYTAITRGKEKVYMVNWPKSQSN